MPVIKHLKSILNHRIGVAFHPLFMESGLDKAALLAMSLTLDGKQTFTENLHQIAAPGLSRCKAARILRQNIAYILRLEKHDEGPIAHVDRDHRTIATLHTLQ